MCTKILLSQLEELKWDGQSAMASPDWRLSFQVQPWAKGLSVVLSLQALRLPDGENDHLGQMLFRDESDRTIVLRRGQEAKLIRNMLQMWVGRLTSKTRWLDKKVGPDARVGPNVHQFVQAVMAKYRDADEIVRGRALDDLRRAVRRAQDSGLTEHDLKVAWDEGLFAQMLAS
jgi:hypothetical protein